MRKETSNMRTKMTDEKKRKYETTESFALNCNFVIGLQQIGGGPADSQVLITYLGLPRGASFRSKTFSRIESKLRPIIKKISDDAMKTAIDEEVKATRTAQDYQKYKRNELPTQSNGLTTCYDMGWNKRSSGNRYDSISGHGILFGARAKKVIGYRAVPKVCSFCNIMKKRNGENAVIQKHECVKNHLGSSKSMESEAILHMVRDAWFNKGFFVEVICSDDDTTMKKVLCHNYDQMIKDL